MSYHEFRRDKLAVMQGAEKVQYLSSFLTVLQPTFNLDQFCGVLCVSSAYLCLTLVH